ncbi:MAG TPA: methyltransferase domain-containing protein [Bryobacteraceae bacterium]|nr:methyltransferase domain-containing protein [Bryobacteraceae bacterium]
MLPNFWERGTLYIAKVLRIDVTHSQKHYARALDSMVSVGCRWLEIGCGRQLLPDWAVSPARQRALAARASVLIGMDVDSAMLEHPLLQQRVIGLGEDMPFAADTFDLISANMVFEHVADPGQVLREVWRILKPGGHLIFHTPNYHNYLVAVASAVPDFVKRPLVRFLEGRREEDIFPTLYRLNTIPRIREVAEACGFEAESIRTNVSTGGLYALGPIAWLECVWLKVISVIGRGAWDAGLIVTLRRPAAPQTAGVPAAGVERVQAA